MPQEGLRSIVYRSFAVCDDPKGVVESGIIRRSESGSEKMERKIGSQKARDRSDVSKGEREGGGIEEHHRSSSSCQLLEVSRGAHKLNQVIDSLSRGNWSGRPSKDIANDLLKGALELQDSLHMLGKLHEESHLARVKKKQKEKIDKVRDDQVIQRMNSSSVGERNSHKAIQNPPLSAGVSSRDCIEELREVIRDGLARQNLLPNLNPAERRSFSSRYPADLASDIPSTSSSRSSSFHTDNLTSMDSSVWSPAEEKKARSPSLIAKLMGLEEMPSKSLQTNAQKDMENKKIFSQHRPIFEIDTPKVRKSRYAFRTEDRERTLKDVLETMHFKGLLKNNFIKEIKPDSYQQRLIDNSAPIVLIKPRYDQHLQPQEKFLPLFQDKGISNTKNVHTKSKAKEDSPSKIIDSSDRGLNFSKMSRRVGAKETPLKRHMQHEGSKDSRENETRTVKKEEKIKQTLPTSVKSSGSITLPLRKKVPTEKNIDMIPKPMISCRKPVEKEVVKAKNVSRSKDQAKVAPRKPINPENLSNFTKNKNSRQPTATANSNSVRRPQTIVRCPIDVKKSSTKKAGSKATVATTEKLECKGDEVVLERKKINLTPENETVLGGKRTDPALENDSLPEEERVDPALGNDFLPEEERIDPASQNETASEGCSIETADQLPIEEGTEHTNNQIGEYTDESSICDVTAVTIDDQDSIISIGEVDDDPVTPIVTESESFTTGTSLEALLSSSPVFVNHAQEHFDLHVNIPTTRQNFCISCDFSDADTRLLLDCANEIVRRRSYPDSQTIRPPWSSLVGKTKRYVSLDHLVRETCDGVEALKSYNELANENYPTDGLYAMMERDIHKSEALSGIWDLGWKKGFSVNDTIQVVEHIEKQLLRGLIAEICT